MTVFMYCMWEKNKNFQENSTIKCLWTCLNFGLGSKQRNIDNTHAETIVLQGACDPCTYLWLLSQHGLSRLSRVMDFVPTRGSQVSSSPFFTGYSPNRLVYVNTRERLPCLRLNFSLKYMQAWISEWCRSFSFGGAPGAFSVLSDFHVCI